jgi:hypothetical protein
MSSIEFWRYEDWTMVYKDGQLQQAGDHYLADEWLQKLCSVKVVDDDAGVCIPDGQNALKTLAYVHAAEEARKQRLNVAENLRIEAARLLAEAAKLESQK